MIVLRIRRKNFIEKIRCIQNHLCSSTNLLSLFFFLLFGSGTYLVRLFLDRRIDTAIAAPKTIIISKPGVAFVPFCSASIVMVN